MLDVARGAIAAGLEEVVGIVEDSGAVANADSFVVLIIVVGGEVMPLTTLVLRWLRQS